MKVPKTSTKIPIWTFLQITPTFNPRRPRLESWRRDPELCLIWAAFCTSSPLSLADGIALAKTRRQMGQMGSVNGRLFGFVASHGWVFEVGDIVGRCKLGNGWTWGISIVFNRCNHGLQFVSGNCETVFRSYWLEKWRGIGSSWVNWMIWLQQSWYELLLVSHHLALGFTVSVSLFLSGHCFFFHTWSILGVCINRCTVFRWTTFSPAPQTWSVQKITGSPRSNGHNWP